MAPPNAKPKFIVQPASHWYDSLPPLSKYAATPTAVTPAQHADLLARATKLHVADTTTFTQSSSSNASSSEASFLQKILQSGTLSDRLSALTLLVQSSPIHNTKALETLKGMAERGKGKGGREESLKALRCVVDWWVGGGVPSRKLRYFRDQPLTNPGVTDEHLVVWYFEDWLKKFFFSVLQIIETISLDPLSYIRIQSLNLISTLLREKPEQEQNLLRLLVNKLGDTEKPICSRASYHLLQLLQTHPSMKGVIVREIIALVLRPSAPSTSAAASTSGAAPSGKHIRFADAEASSAKSKSKPKIKGKGTKAEPKNPTNAHARYYATITFNQIVLTPLEKDRDVARQLVEVYFELFKEVLGEGGGSSDDVGEGEGDGAKDRGDGEEDDDEVKTDKHGRVRTRENGKGKGKKKVETRGAAGFAEVEDVNSKLVSAILTGVNRAMPFARIDKDDSRLSKHIDTLFLITHKSTFNISLQALVLIQQTVSSLVSTLPATSTKSSSSAPSEKSKTKKSISAPAKSITARYYRTLYASLHDVRLATSSKQAMYLNLLFKSIKGCVGIDMSTGTSGKGGEDTRWGTECARALVRRFVQVLVSGGGGAAEFVAGGLFLLGELFSTVPGLRAALSASPESSETYDPKKRDPQYAHASSSPIWELTPLLNHYHPAIALHARQLLSGTPLTASADLSLNTLSHFLDRFVYKNAKKGATKSSGAGDDDENAVAGGGARGPSLMQPAASALDGAVSGVKLIKGEVARARGGQTVMVNESAFMRRRVEDVPVDQVFFHKFFTTKNEKEKATATKAGKRKGAESDSESGLSSDNEEGSEDAESDGEQPDDSGEDDGSELDEAEIWKAMKATIPKMDGDDDLLDDSEGTEDEDEILSGLEDGDSIFSSDEDEVDAETGEGGEANDDGDESDALSLAEMSDDEDLLPLDANVPSGLIDFDGSDADSDVEEDLKWGGIDDANTKSNKGADKKRKRKEESSGARRKRLRALPTFASYEDYAKMIEDGPEDEI